MLAYLFWHRPTSSAEADGYELRLAAFHDRLAAEPPRGFRGSAAFRVSLPWIGDGYEDWYLVSNWDALGALNRAAVDGAHRADHDAVADAAADGTGSVYELRAGQLPLVETGAADWSAKPRGVPYAAWEAGVTESRRPREFALWQRQLVLGPAPEYCLLTPGSDMTLVSGRR